MNNLLLAASVAAAVLGIAHSIIGDLLIFKPLRQKQAENDDALRILSRRRWAAIWSTWHLLTIFGFGIAGVLFVLALNPAATYPDLKLPLVAAFAIGGVFWVYGTAGKHPAWIILLGIAALLWQA
ncbi:MAG: hypothetical protein ABL893_06200 [Hyphomicrobium sp.]